MGADGGSIPKRKEMVKHAHDSSASQKDDLQLGKEAILMDRWTCCYLTREPLSDPVVACRLGRMYNKDALLEYLISLTNGKIDETEKSKEEDEEPSVVNKEMSHIKRMKDVKQLKLSPNPSFKSEKNRINNGTDLGKLSFKYLCPITRKEMNGTHAFLFSWPCGCVYSQDAFKELSKSSDTASKDSSNECIICGTKIKDPELDIVTLYPKSDELEKIKQHLIISQSHGDSKKKKKKRKLEHVDDSV